MKFEWDYNKAKTNEQKHGVSFEIAEHIFSSDMVVKEDIRHDYKEQRYSAFSLYFGRCINVIYTMRGDNIRIISIRKANEREAKEYRKSTKSN